jgi:hypothetical protein
LLRQPLTDAVKVPHKSAGLEERLAEAAWRVTVVPTSGPFYWWQPAEPGDLRNSQRASPLSSRPNAFAPPGFDPPTLATP